MAHEWFVAVHGREQGPVSSAHLRALASAGRIDATTPVRRSDLESARPAGDIKGLAFSGQRDGLSDERGAGRGAVSAGRGGARTRYRERHDDAWARRRLRNGAIAGFIVSGLSLVLVLLVMSRGGQVAGMQIDAWGLLDVALVAGLSFGVLKGSRVAAILLLVNYVLGRVVWLSESGSLVSMMSGLGVALLIVYYLGWAVHGAFAQHRHRRAHDPAYQPARGWKLALWTPVALIEAVVLLGAVGLAASDVPLDLVPGTALSDSQLTVLRGAGVVDRDEYVVVFHSAGLLSILEDGNIVTDRRVISYELDDGELYLDAMPFEEVADIQVEHQGGALSCTEIVVSADDGRQLLLLGPGDATGDARLLSELRGRVAHARAGSASSLATLGR